MLYRGRVFVRRYEVYLPYKSFIFSQRRYMTKLKGVSQSSLVSRSNPGPHRGRSAPTLCFSLANLPSTHVSCHASILPPNSVHVSGVRSTVPLATTAPALSNIFSPMCVFPIPMPFMRLSSTAKTRLPCLSCSTNLCTAFAPPVVVAAAAGRDA